MWGGTSTTTGAKLGSTPPTRGSGTTSFITQKIREGERPIMFNLAWAYVRVVGMSRKGVGIYFCVLIIWDVHLSSFKHIYISGGPWAMSHLEPPPSFLSPSLLKSLKGGVNHT